MFINKRAFLVAIFSSFLLLACQEKKEEETQIPAEEPHVFDLMEIKAKGELRALVDNSTTSYFLYKGIPMGFEYELLKRFTAEIGVDLKIIPINNLSSIIDSLEEYKGDIIAANLTITKTRLERMAFTQALIRTKQVLVQRVPASNEHFVQYLDELIGKEVYVQRGSSFYQRLQSLSDEIGGEIQIKEVAGNTTVEELIERVASGEIEYTIADEHVAKINKSFHRNIHIKKAISLEQQLAWAVRKESPDLLITLNDWLEKFKKTTDFRVIYLKYYGNTSLYKQRINSTTFTSKSGKISPFDALIQQHATKIGWDWRLLTSLIYQESGFNHESSSWLGAQGLMQLMPATAEQYGLDSTATPEENILAGISYLNWLDSQFENKVEDQEERKFFVMAAYNVGLGHVFDAIRLAEKHGLNPKLWKKNVAEMILKKSNPEYYHDEVVHYGYCRGKEPYRYVNEIIERYEHYVNMTETEVQEKN